MNNMIRISGAILLILMINSCKKNDDNSIKDADGNAYTSVTIGTQVWMVENLRTTKYLNGDLIGTTTPATLDITNESTPKYQWAFEGSEYNVANYGRLYTWFAVTDSRNVCPVGWHVPTNDEWTTLTTYLGSDSVAGGKLKEIGTFHWLSPNVGATNSSGFTALPGGMRHIYGSYNLIGNLAFWWCSTEGSTLGGYNRAICSCGSDVGRGDGTKQNGFSVRCLKDN
jgi:uncharacterized protein (TIGR02145 family)